MIEIQLLGFLRLSSLWEWMQDQRMNKGFGFGRLLWSTVTIENNNSFKYKISTKYKTSKLQKYIL